MHGMGCLNMVGNLQENSAAESFSWQDDDSFAEFHLFSEKKYNLPSDIFDNSCFTKPSPRRECIQKVCFFCITFNFIH